MTKKRTALAGKAAFGASALLLAVALPSAGFAFGALAENAAVDVPDTFLSFTPANADPRLAEFIAQQHGDSRMMRFTPAGSDDSPSARSVTVAVRVDQQTADALAANNTIGSQRSEANRSAGLRVASTRYNLGLARGYSSFAQSQVASQGAAPARKIATPDLSSNLSRARIPDLSDFAPRAATKDKPSRFAARIELDEDRAADDVAVSGETLTDQMLDVAGSYRLTRNLDITAGVRYEQDRDLLPVPDLEQQDSQAVYIGTQFRF
ncbi:hypothetical protein [Aurantiacibacter rhizosphaerae]|uniref:Porin n=1 Tax=Aurantiacibacter rhizosphaerae TaxID=2691582 RepID=A0A844X9Q8_9SPHN|nr:hypothetical protein [Aurantiacibacter rhizosphaerae]MWV26519.1 hypothetical protein [Aurantiacibacter rhizosphaerae]